MIEIVGEEANQVLEYRYVKLNKFNHTLVDIEDADPHKIALARAPRSSQ